MMDVSTPLEDRDRPSHFLSSPTLSDTGAADVLFSPALMLPKQFFSPPRSSPRGAIALMRAVLEDALNCFARQFVTDDSRTQDLAREAKEWFLSDDEDWPFSFVNVCAALEMNPEYIRRGLKQHAQARLAQIRQSRHHVACRSICLRTAV
jgi:hypothetical protein